MSKSKEYGEQLYEAAVLTVGAVGVSYASRKLTKDTLGVPMTLSAVLQMRPFKPGNPILRKSPF